MSVPVPLTAECIDRLLDDAERVLKNPGIYAGAISCFAKDIASSIVQICSTNVGLDGNQRKRALVKLQCMLKALIDMLDEGDEAHEAAEEAMATAVPASSGNVKAPSSTSSAASNDNIVPATSNIFAAPRPMRLPHSAASSNRAAAASPRPMRRPHSAASSNRAAAVGAVAASSINFASPRPMRFPSSAASSNRDSPDSISSTDAVCGVFEATVRRKSHPSLKCPLDCGQSLSREGTFPQHLKAFDVLYMKGQSLSSSSKALKHMRNVLSENGEEVLAEDLPKWPKMAVEAIVSKVEEIITDENKLDSLMKNVQYLAEQQNWSIVDFMARYSRAVILRLLTWLLEHSGSVDQTQATLDAFLSRPGVITAVVGVLESHNRWEVRKEAARVLSNLCTGGAPHRIEKLVELEVIGTLCKTLLVDDSTIVAASLNAIEAIVKAGEKLGRLDYYLLQIDEAKSMRVISTLKMNRDGVCDWYI